MTPHVTAAVPKLKNVFVRCQRWPGLCLCFAALSWKAPALPDHFPLSVGADVSCLPTSCFSTPWAFPEDPTCSVKFPAQHTCCSTSSSGAHGSVSRCRRTVRKGILQGGPWECSIPTEEMQPKPGPAPSCPGACLVRAWCLGPLNERLRERSKTRLSPNATKS